MSRLERPPQRPAGEGAATSGVAMMAVVAVLSAIDVVIVRTVSPDVHPLMIGFTRALFGLVVVLPWILARPGVLKSNYTYRHVLRAALKLASLVAFFAAFATAPLADATAIAFTAPLFVTIGAWLMLGEAPRAMRIVALVLGFAGVLVVLRPGAGGLSPGLGLALVGAALAAVIQLVLKPMTARDSTETLIAWNLIATVPIAALPALFVWSTPTPSQWALLIVQGVLGAASMGLVTRAFALADASLLTAIDFMRLPIVAGLAYWLFGQSVSAATLVGAGVIFVATLLMARTARVATVLR